MSDLSAPLALLEARGLAFLRRDEPIFGPLDFAVHAGELLLLEGDNGSGKTTLLRVLATMLQGNEGEVLLHGRRLNRENAAGELLYLGHQLGLKTDLTSLENLTYSQGLYGRRRSVTPMTAIEGVGLAGYEHEPVKHLSAGQKKRVALARLILVPAAVWLLDEPWANLDQQGIALVNRLIARHVDEGGAVLASSHGTVSYVDRAFRRIGLSS